MEGENSEDEVYEPHLERRTSPSDSIFGDPNSAKYAQPQFERRTSPSDSIFGDPNSEKYIQSHPVSTQNTAQQSEPDPSPEEKKQIKGFPVGQPRTVGGSSRISSSLMSRGGQDVPEIFPSIPSQTYSAAYVGEAKRGHVPSVKLKELAEDSASEVNGPSRVSEKNLRWQIAPDNSDSSAVRKIAAGKNSGQPARVHDVRPTTLGPSVEPMSVSVESAELLPQHVHQRPFFDQRALEITSNKVMQAFTCLALMHIVCALLFAANSYFLPLYNLKESTGGEVGKITFQEIEIYCGECHETSTLSSEVYLDVCGIDATNESATEGFISDWTTAAFLTYIAMLMAAGNIAILGIVLCFLLARKLTDNIPQVLVILGGAVSLGELFVGLIVPLQTQMGTWDRDKVNDIFALSDFQCENPIYVFSSYGFLIIWIVLGCVIVDIALTFRLFLLVRSL